MLDCYAESIKILVPSFKTYLENNGENVENRYV